MNFVVMWMLVVSTVGGHGPTPVHKFSSEAACTTAADEVFKKSSERRSMPFLNGICIQVEVYK